MINLGNKTFSSKKEVYSYASLLLFKHKLDEFVTDKEDLLFLIDLFLTLPRVKNKIRTNIIVGVKVCKIGRHKCFKILTALGTLLKFSIYKCTCTDKYEGTRVHINDESKDLLDVNLFIKRFKLAGRKAIEIDIRDYKIKNKKYFKSLGRIKLEVDHIYPLTYAQIVYNYLLQYPGDWRKIKFDKYKIYSFKDRKDFRDYHKRVAKLRILPKMENRKQPNPKINWDILINKLLDK